MRYICYVAFKIATAPVVTDDTSGSAPNFQDGFILNLLNPKAYAAFLAIFSQFLLPFANSVISYFVTGAICLLVAAIVDVLWLSFGGLLKPFFTHPIHARIIRIVFALLMLSAVIYATL